MKPQTLEAWQVYASRCKRLDAEAERAIPWWVGNLHKVLMAEAALGAAILLWFNLI